MRIPSTLLFAVLAAAAPSAAQSVQTKSMIAEVVATGSLLVRHVTFDAGSEALAASSDGALEELRAVLAEHDEWTFEVQVHTDDGGTAERDAALSTARAKAVVSWLTRQGIAASRLVPRGFGSTRPLRELPAGDASLVHNRLELRKLNEE